MDNTDFSACAYIKDQMQYYTFDDFIENCTRLKTLYLELKPNAKIFYKWYVYANIHMNENYKNAIWTFLNSEDLNCYIYLLQLKGGKHGKRA